MFPWPGMITCFRKCQATDASRNSCRWEVPCHLISFQPATSTNMVHTNEIRKEYPSSRQILGRHHNKEVFQECVFVCYTRFRLVVLQERICICIQRDVESPGRCSWFITAWQELGTCAELNHFSHLSVIDMCFEMDWNLSVFVWLCVCTCMSSPRRTFPERSRWTRLLGMDGLALSDWQRLFTPKTHQHRYRQT